MKNLNLIKRLWTDSHEKQKVRGMQKYCILLLLLFTCVTHAYASDYNGGMVYFDNSNTNWTYSHIYLIIGKSDWSTTYRMTAVPGTSYYQAFLPSSGWNDATYIAIGGKNGKVDEGKWSDVNSKFSSYSTKKSQSGGLSKANYIFTPSSTSNNFDFTINTGVPSCPTAVLNQSKIMVYGGELTGWSQTTYDFMSEKTHDKTVATAKKGTLIKNIDSQGDTWFCPVMLPSGTYYQAHSGWTPELSCSIDAGYAYIIRGTTSSSYFQQMSKDDKNYLYKVKKGGSTDPTTSVTTTLETSSFEVGTSTLNVSTTGGPGKSVLDFDNMIQYYLYDGSSYTKVTLDGSGNLDVSTLPAGDDYVFVTVLYDGWIFVRADAVEFEVIDASGHDITYTPQSTGWTYGTKPSAAEEGDVVTFEVIPTDGYSVTVESEDVTLTKDGNEYTFTMPDEDVEITVSASPKNYAITYSPASAPIGAVYTTTPANANYGSTVNLTIDRWAGYSTSVSVKDEDDGNVSVTNATSRTPSFTMPAKAVTVTVTATKINKPIVYVLKTNVAAGSNIENFSSVSSDADNVLFWGWGNGGSDNFYTSASWNSDVKLSDARVGTYIDEHGNTWYEFISNRSTFNLSTEYMVILRLKDTRNLYESNADGHWVDGTECNSSTNTYFKGITWIVPNGKTSEHSAQLYTSNPDGITRASIASVDFSLSRVPPLAPITATPTMYDVVGIGEKAYCWGVYTDLACTNQVTSVSFTSLGDGKVQFAAPQAEKTYYLKLTVRASAACDAAIDDEKVVSFTVSTSQMVFFKNVPGWGNVHFYFLGDSYWDSEPDPDKNKGSGCAGRDGGSAHGMTRIGNSNVYYYDYSGNSVMTTYLSSHSSCYIAFTDNYKPGSNNFAGCQAAYRGDFSACAPMYVPENWITNYCNKGSSDGQAAYYNRGYWTKYMSAGSGFTLHVYDSKTIDAGTEIFYHEMEGTVGNNTYTFTYDFAGASQLPPYTYGFEVSGCGGSWYAVEADMDITNCKDWNIYTGSSRRGGIAVDGKLEHTFILTLTGDGHIQLSVEYPLAEGDYRLLYDDETQKPHPSQYIRARANGKDTVSMFIRPSTDEALLKVQKCTDLDPITWEDYDWKTDVDTIYIAGKTDGVYNFYLEQDGSKNLTVKTSATEPYSGKYYIRTSVVNGGWTSYKTSDDNLMTYAQYPDDRGYGFNYYKAKWVEATGSDVTYTIACDYSPSLSDTLVADPGNNPLSAAEARSLPHSANIRFGWHSGTNQLKREYINGSTNISDRFLVMMGDAKMKDSEGNALNIPGLDPNEISFTDLNNWIYRCDIQAQTGAAVKLQATYDGHEQYFIGDEDKTEEIIGGSSGGWYGMRVTYDFKTNRLMTAWLPSGTEVAPSVVLNADMMLIRKGQEAATQVYFNGNGNSISNIHRIYGVLEFQYDNIVNKFSSWSSTNAYKYLMYYISFPFDVKVSEIFGCGVRGENWIIQKYNGAKRAQIGWFAETSTFWETLPGDSTLHANEGYLLILDRISFNDASSSLWYKQGSGNSIYLYFPSTSATSGTISESTATIKVPSHPCTIDRSFTPAGGGGSVNHKNTDSHWNVIGTPLFENKTASTIVEGPTAGVETLQYYYAWNSVDNTLAAQAAFDDEVTFKSMHAYMVQYAGDVTFNGAKLTPPASVAAHRVPGEKKNYRIKLRMENESGNSSDAYVELRENACDTFALNEDMYMMRSSSKADLYTFAGNYDVAANVLSMNNHIVPVGMDVKRAGTYRFTMPSDFSGTVTLVDTETGVRTNLALGDYELALPKGISNTRFLLEIDIHQMPTAIDGVGGSLKDGKAHKFIENGQMYILRNGVIYDAQGRKMK